VALIDENLEPLVRMLEDLELKPRYDENFERGHIIQRLPLETAVLYYKYRKILVISPRDMVMLCKIHRVTHLSKYNTCVCR
jgi:hypothetical protein